MENRIFSDAKIIRLIFSRLKKNSKDRNNNDKCYERNARDEHNRGAHTTVFYTTTIITIITSTNVISICSYTNVDSSVTFDDL